MDTSVNDTLSHRYTPWPTPPSYTIRCCREMEKIIQADVDEVNGIAVEVEEEEEVN